MDADKIVSSLLSPYAHFAHRVIGAMQMVLDAGRIVSPSP